MTQISCHSGNIKGYHYFLVTKGYWVVEIHLFSDLQIEKYHINRCFVLRFYSIVLTLVWLHFSLCTAIATIKVHLAATVALYFETLLVYRRVCVHCIKE